MKSEADALTADPRFATLVAINPDGSTRSLTFSDHYAVVSKLDVLQSAPASVSTVYRRSLHCLLYAWFDYELLVVAEAQALSSLEHALKLRLNRAPTAPTLRGLGPRLDAAIAAGVLPPSDPSQSPHEYYLLRALRNDLAHGSEDVHPPALAVEVVRRCGDLIMAMYPS